MKDREGEGLFFFMGLAQKCSLMRRYLSRDAEGRSTPLSKEAHSRQRRKRRPAGWNEAREERCGQGGDGRQEPKSTVKGENSQKMERAGPLPSSLKMTDLSEQHPLEWGIPGPGPAQPLPAADTTMTLLPELGTGMCPGEDGRGRWILMNTSASSITTHSADTRALRC